MRADSGSKVSQMAASPAHRLGQIIGYALEVSVLPLLRSVASDHQLYLDTIGPRVVRGGRKLITWTDQTGSKSNLDFVLEKGGSDTAQGSPVAFIEVAWRRYTKHSVNKAGEITQALVPLRRTYSATRPFVGAIVAGTWTQTGLDHMLNQGLRVLYIPMHVFVAAFASYNIDIDLREDTTEDFLLLQVSRWDALSQGQRENLSLSLMTMAPERFERFREQLDADLRRRVVSVFVLPLTGDGASYDSSAEAVLALRAYQQDGATPGPFVRFEIQVRYSNGDRIDGSFVNESDAIDFLENRV